MMHTNCKIGNLAHACLGFLCKFSIKTPCGTGVLNSYYIIAIATKNVYLNHGISIEDATGSCPHPG